MKTARSQLEMSPAHSDNSEARRTVPQAPRQLPDRTICRAKRSGFGDYADCLVVTPASCICALSFGAGYLCLHPERQKIIAATEANAPGDQPGQT